MSRRRLSTVILAVLAIVVCAGRIAAGRQDGQAPRRLASASAESLIADGLNRAQAEHKRVFVDFRASWCGPCLELQRFLQGPETKPIVDAHFVIVPITVWEQADNKRLNNEGGEKYLKAYGGGASIPFYAFLDEAGQRIANGSGYPYGSAEIDTLMDSMVKVAPGMSERDRAILFEQLAGSTSHRMWAAASIDGATMSPSGRYLAYTRMETPGVRVHDFVAGADRPLAQVGDDPRAGSFVFSHDNRSLAYSSAGADGTAQLRIAAVSNADPSPARLLVSDRSFKRIDPYAWTPDNGGIVIVGEGANSAGATVSIVSAADWSIHERRPFPEGIAMLALAPDGRTMALELGHRGGTGRIVLMPVEAGEPGAAIAGELIGWSPDGAFILFARRVVGVRRLWTAAVQRGKLSNLVREREVDFTLGDSRSIGLTDAGVFYYLAPPHATRPPAVWIVNDVFPRK